MVPQHLSHGLLGFGKLIQMDYSEHSLAHSKCPLRVYQHYDVTELGRSVKGVLKSDMKSRH